MFQCNQKRLHGVVVCAAGHATSDDCGCVSRQPYSEMTIIPTEFNYNTISLYCVLEKTQPIYFFFSECWYRKWKPCYFLF